MSTGLGRSLRVVAGLILIVLGFVGGGGWITLSIVGLVPLVAGLMNVCLLAPLLGQPLKGSPR
ncbi:MAG: DUF2892 domain-containing protein [Acidobacteriota bacterium]|nr:DUF2892 domain-containing protein [Acidobacteriota bacterium]MDE3031014.1 DUF2892 domain-containing protein [Acidobacteriota bacterium]MDE3093792.1 DUF2892 domain-containing protein [Acidobacteriota bacterium]MDE3139754.1 DUF2892 domain-containing protein [Acidobacteriota bacterium]MDE3147276.1 DUF2892 domain-containing protein [Acidobacteriota bacterium]